MLYHYKALLVVIFLTTASFMLSRRVFLTFMSARDFVIRRNAWLLLTMLEFLVPEFWSFLLLFGIVTAITSRRDSNPVAHYVFLLLAILPISAYAYVPGVISNFMLLDHLRVLGIVILLPVAIKCLSPARGAQAVLAPPGTGHRMSFSDLTLVAYVILQMILAAPYSPASGVLRFIVELLLFTIVPYYAISRYIRTRESLIDVMAAFSLSLVILVPLAIFETTRHWALYEGMQTQWDKSAPLEYLMRGPFLRAQVTGGHSLVFGFSMAIAFGFWLSLQGAVESKFWRILGTVAFVGGLAASFARGPWVGAFVILVAFFALGPNSARRTGLLILAIGAVCGLVMVTPYAADIIDYLPFIGTVGEGSVDYRQRIAEVAWEIVKVHPIFGSFDTGQSLEVLRQGQGIIDIVNTYAAISMSYGLVGLALYLLFYLTLAYGCWREARRIAEIDLRLSLAGTSLVACLLGALITIATVSQYLSVPVVQLVIAGLARAYIAICRTSYAQEAAGEPLDDAAFSSMRLSR